MGAPLRVGDALMGRDAKKSTPRTLLRFYGTRDVVLGLGTLRAAASGSDVRAWIAAGIASDALDSGVVLAEWNDIARDKRVQGLLAALGAGVAGALLLTRV